MLRADEALGQTAPESHSAPRQAPPWPFGTLRPLGYRCLMVDPPWKQLMRSSKGYRKSPERHYRTMTLDEICALPVHELAAGDCLLMLWALRHMLPEALKVMAAWGFRYKTSGYWRKTTKLGRVTMGTGYILRGGGEPYLIGTIGKPRILSHAERDCFDGLRREHSRKPDEARAMLARLTEGPFAEIFACEETSGWDGWGDEIGKFK